MVELKMKGFLGNNLFQYAIARIVCQEMGYALKIIESEYKKEFNNKDLRSLMKQFQDAPFEIPGQNYESPIDNTHNVDFGEFDGYNANLNKIISNKHNRKIRLCGSFERYELLRPYKDQIRNWYHIASDDLGYNIGDRDVVLHVRWGDFVLEGRAIAMSFYTDALRGMDFDKLYVCGYALGREVKDALMAFNPIYISGDAVGDFKFMMSFKKMILSPSTFAWWAAFLSDAEEIIVPLPKRHHREGLLPIDLRVFDESRYTYIENVPMINREIKVEDIRIAWKMLPHKRKMKWINRWINGQLLKTTTGKILLNSKKKCALVAYQLMGIHSKN